MSGGERDATRALQDRVVIVLVLARVNSTMGENEVLFQGGPSLSQIKSLLYPGFAYRFREFLADWE